MPSALMSTELDKLKQKIDPKKLPRHVAIIMDGNGRWAKKRRLPRLFGHNRGAQSVRQVVEAAGEIGVEFLTLYAFSTENWSRPKAEVSGLMELLKKTLIKEEPYLNENNVRLETIGDITALPEDVQLQLSNTKKNLSGNSGLTLILALNYGGRQELAGAYNRLMEKGVKNVTPDMIGKELETAAFPDPDLLIRTSGEVRVSNFLLWQIAYSELVITQEFWPEFRKKSFFEAILTYQSRDRRFGGAG